MVMKGFDFDQFPPDLRSIAKTRWPNGPNFTMAPSVYFGEEGYVALLRKELDEKELVTYMAKNKGKTALARKIEEQEQTNLRLELEVKKLRKMQIDVHEAVKFESCDRDEDEEED